jgi:hypothetical protein
MSAPQARSTGRRRVVEQRQQQVLHGHELVARMAAPVRVSVPQDKKISPDLY